MVHNLSPDRCKRTDSTIRLVMGAKYTNIGVNLLLKSIKQVFSLYDNLPASKLGLTICHNLCRSEHTVSVYSKADAQPYVVRLLVAKFVPFGQFVQ